MNPKATMRLAGAILGQILESVAAKNIDDAVVVVAGAIQAQVVGFATRAFGDRFEFDFFEQEQALGPGHSFYQDTDTIGDRPVLVGLADMPFEHGENQFLKATTGGAGNLRREQALCYRPRVAYDQMHDLAIRTVLDFKKFGPRIRQEDGFLVPTILSQAHHGEDLRVYGSGTQPLSLRYVDDLVRGFVPAPRRQPYGPPGRGSLSAATTTSRLPTSPT